MAVSATAPPEGTAAATMGVKRKPELFDEPDDDHRQSLFIYNMTMSKLVTSTPTRHKPVEPSLQRSVLIRNTLRRLEASISSMTPPAQHPPHSPRKKLQCSGWSQVAVASTDSQTDFQLLLNGLVISSEENNSCPAAAASQTRAAAAAPAAMEVEPEVGASQSQQTAEDELAAAVLAQVQANALAESAAPTLVVASRTAEPASAAGDVVAALACSGDAANRATVPRKDSSHCSGPCSSPAGGGSADGPPRGAATDGGFDEIDASLLSELDAFCSAAAATRAASADDDEFDGIGCSAVRDVRYDELDNILQVLVGM